MANISVETDPEVATLTRTPVSGEFQTASAPPTTGQLWPRGQG